MHNCTTYTYSLTSRRERSSSADSMEHALARPSSPRTTRERGGLRRGTRSSSVSASASSDTGSESEDEGNPAKTRRAAPESEQVKQAQNVPLTSGNIRYTGHKDIKLTLNKVWVGFSVITGQTLCIQGDPFGTQAGIQRN